MINMRKELEYYNDFKKDMENNILFLLLLLKSHMFEFLLMVLPVKYQVRPADKNDTESLLRHDTLLRGIYFLITQTVK